MRSPVARSGPGGFSGEFYLANIMEIFERVAWYGFFTVSSLYITTSTHRGGLGFTNAQRGVLQGVIPFLVYLLPVFSGAVADRIGYRRMFIVAFLILIPAYLLLGEMRGFWPFFVAYVLVGLGAGIFKPLAVGTVARTTTAVNRGVGFGIFYLMVNVGGFLGPVLAGVLRAIGWKWVFVMCSATMVVNLVLTLAFFRDAPRIVAQESGGIRSAMRDAQHVLGNGRFALAVAVLVVGLMVAGGSWISWRSLLVLALAWAVLQWLWNLGAVNDEFAPWYRQRLQVGNAPFLIYLLVISLFWAAYYQIYLTLPLYIRDFVDTSDLVQLATHVSPSLADFLAHVDIQALTQVLQEIASKYATTPSAEGMREIRLALAQVQVMPPPDALLEGLRSMVDGGSASVLALSWAQSYRQVNPEYIVALDFLTIVILQYMVSSVVARVRVFVVLVAGTLLIAASYLLGGIAHALPFAGAAAAGMVVLFALGEMLAAPKSQEYVAAIAPEKGAALFMGYYFVSSALGLLLAGVLSGWGYESLAVERGQPGLMWVLFAGVAVVAAIALLGFNASVAARFSASGARAVASTTGSAS